MSDGGAPSRYVKLTKEQAPVDEVNPGELNQPIQVPHVCFSLSLSLSTDLISLGAQFDITCFNREM